jgi:hypothetical protein
VPARARPDPRGTHRACGAPHWCGGCQTVPKGLSPRAVDHRHSFCRAVPRGTAIRRGGVGLPSTPSGHQGPGYELATGESDNSLWGPNVRPGFSRVLSMRWGQSADQDCGKRHTTSHLRMRCRTVDKAVNELWRCGASARSASASSGAAYHPRVTGTGRSAPNGRGVRGALDSRRPEGCMPCRELAGRAADVAPAHPATPGWATTWRPAMVTEAGVGAPGRSETTRGPHSCQVGLANAIVAT